MKELIYIFIMPLRHMSTLLHYALIIHK